ncbi:DinB family protein [Planctomicrobium sp. SH668]|uniref:DinB family protein n=1 Tax=Planctomicrobium sp. SH668 TaxID=3448126 RepID=UPI003F5B6FA5
MTPNEVITTAINSAGMICGAYLGDLTDAEMMHRPAEGSNHINWQLGHLILSENRMIEDFAPGTMPALPDGFAEKYSKETGLIDDPAAFESKETLMAAYQSQRAATLAAVAKLTDEDLNRPSGVDYAPNGLAIYLMQSTHWLMHCGQWAVVRRQLGRPPVI